MVNEKKKKTVKRFVPNQENNRYTEITLSNKILRFSSLFAENFVSQLIMLIKNISQSFLLWLG